MALSRRSGRSRFTLALLVLTSITVITLDFRGEGSGIVDSIREAAIDLFAPVQSAAETVVSPVSNVWNGITEYDDLEDENARLRAELEDLEGAELDDYNARRQTQELIALMDLDFAGDIPAVAARVVSAPSSNFALTVELDKGTADGIEENMPVVTGAGLVGRVVQASKERSVVLVITDLESSVGVRLTRSRDVTVANGAGRNQDLTLELIDVNTTVRRGEPVVTSGLNSSLFPADIPVGRVSEVGDADGDLERVVTVKPAVNLRRLEFVKVLQYAPRAASPEPAAEPTPPAEEPAPPPTSTTTP